MQDNIFEAPEKYIKEIVDKVRIPQEKRKKFPGKTMAFLFLTKFCDVECAHCFFKSRKNVNNEHSKEYEFTEEGLEKVIEFINKSNNGYLSVLGGGEPFNRFDYVLELIKRVKTDRMILVTSANWAVDAENARNTIHQIKEALNSREDKLNLVLRVSIDKWHALKIGSKSILNCIEVMRTESTENFTLEAHTLVGDNTLDEALKSGRIKYKKETYAKYVSDNNDIMKLGYARYIIRFEDGYKINVGIARKFNSNLKVDLNHIHNLDKILAFFDNDIKINCFGNPSIVHDSFENEGLDFLISYNGNVTTWGNDQPYDLNNLYIHDYDTVISKTMDNIISYSFIEKGFKYRENIFNEVNEKAVIKSKAINIRDYSGNLLFEEASSVLYYGIRVVKDYIKENILDKKILDNLSSELKEAILLETGNLRNLYKLSEYSIIDQYKKDETKTLEEWQDLMELIRLGHYDISASKIKDGIEYINSKFGQGYNSIEEFKFSGEEQYNRLLNRISDIAKEAL